jgi:glutamyl-Q tRNA(Asp) synthetase
MLVWLDAKQQGGKAVLRLENLDPLRCKPDHLRHMIDCLHWMGFTWDAVVTQSDNRTDHESAIDELARKGVLYTCRCTRSDLHGGGSKLVAARRAPDGSWAYSNRCRDSVVSAEQWRQCDLPLRVRLPDGGIIVRDQSGADYSQIPSLDMGDPIVRRRDGAISYQLAVVVDDMASNITDVIRGRDIAPSTATQVALYNYLGAIPPRYRHHFLLLENNGKASKLAKLHGSIPFEQLRARYDAPSLLGQLAFAANIVDQPIPLRLEQLVCRFNWANVRIHDRVTTFDPQHGLQFGS